MTARVVTGDCLELMPTLDAESIDAIVTDPPYGLTANKKGGSGNASMNLDSPYGRARIGTGDQPGGFMGQKWDSAVPGPEYWAAALRVAKPGAHLVAFGGTRTFHRLACAIEDAGWEIRDCLSWLYGSGFPKSHNGPWGGTALKPAWEPIIVARKPLVGTVAANVQAHGTGALNIDGCRIGFTNDADRASAFPGGRTTSHGAGSLAGPGAAQDAERSDFTAERNTLGRWPANVCLDEDAAALLDAQSGTSKSPSGTQRPGVEALGRMNDDGWTPRPREVEGYGDTGGASRFFYTAKASRAERNAEGATKNHHPTVKPLALMQWLCRLVTPRGGLILDPFCGSGTTGRAALAEGFSFIGIELSEEYATIARARIADYAPLFSDGAA